MSEVTRILARAHQGDARAADELLPLVYDELRRLAARLMAQEGAGHTLQPTALVHEAWLRLGGEGEAQFDGRAHFYGAAAESMRRILIDRARRRRARRHGGGLVRVDLDTLDVAAPGSDAELLAVHQVLDEFAAVEPQAASLVKLRCFAGLNMAQAAETLGQPLRTTERLWAYARAWLRRRLSRAED